MLGLDKEEIQCSKLSEKTMDVLDNDALVNLFVSTQKNNLDLCIEKAIKLVIIFICIYIYSEKSTESHGKMVVSCYLGMEGINEIQYRAYVTKGHCF
jgi:hypothetical protein